jgi:NADH:ubiquinone oxidoreductase subunit 4 (subunit M)
MMIFLGIRIEFPEHLDMTAVVGYGFAAMFLLQVLRRIYLDYLRKDRDR